MTFSASLEDFNMNNCISVMRRWSSRKLHWSSFIFNVWLLFVTKYFTKQWASLHSAAAVWGSPWKPSKSRHEALCKDWPVRLYRCVCEHLKPDSVCDGNSTVHNYRTRLNILNIGLNIFSWREDANTTLRERKSLIEILKWIKIWYILTPFVWLRSRASTFGHLWNIIFVHMGWNVDKPCVKPRTKTKIQHFNIKHCYN